MDARAHQRHRGERLLLDDIKRLDALEFRVPARERVEAALGAELATRLLAALTPRRRHPSVAAPAA
jgi:hypothetical protein